MAIANIHFSVLDYFWVHWKTGGLPMRVGTKSPLDGLSTRIAAHNVQETLIDHGFDIPA